MEYLKCVCAVFVGIWLCFAVLLLHYGVFAVLGIFKRRTFQQTDRKLKYGIIIAARNEETVIGPLLDSIRAQNYPKHLLTPFVVAHNCTDRTAEIARAHGAVVYPYNNAKERTAGYAYRYLFQQIRRDWADQPFDGYFVINADNVLSPDYVARMNDAFVETEGKHVITSYRDSGNFADNVMSCLYGIFFLSACRYEARGRTVCGVSTRISGTGYVMPAKLVEDGWEYVTLTEDWEFSADQISKGTKILYCDDAIFYDEQPTTMPVMLRQRLRWACGHMIVFFTRFKALCRAVFSRQSGLDRKSRFSAYDIAMSILPLGVISLVLMAATFAAFAASPHFGVPAAVLRRLGRFLLLLTAISWGITVLFGALLVALEHKRIPKMPPLRMACALLLWPLFLTINIFLDVASLFCPNLEWKTIPHRGAAESCTPKAPAEQTPA